MLTPEEIKKYYSEIGQSGSKLVTGFEYKAHQLVGEVIVAAMLGLKSDVIYWNCGEEAAVKIAEIIRDWGFPVSIQYDKDRIDLIIPAFWTN